MLCASICYKLSNPVIAHRPGFHEMNPFNRIAVVEDEPGLLGDLVEFLLLRGFDVAGFKSAEAFFAAWPAAAFDLLLLDVALPGASGLDIAQRVRASAAGKRDVGIVMLTALDADAGHLQGLDAGADVYLSKRSSLDVIEATCRSVLRRLAPASSGELSGAARQPWRLNAASWRLQAPTGAWLDLTQAEVVLLAVLFEHPGTAIPRETLLDRLGKRETLPGLRGLENTTSRLRRKVQAACGVELPVRPSYGKGYTFTGPCEVQA
ncbi:MAG: response regulator transcription factor [Comamonadaceae bacterium]|nr:MAG: response regulator transcription factor [Comamonadaceae bacterium]